VQRSVHDQGGYSKRPRDEGDQANQQVVTAHLCISSQYEPSTLPTAGGKNRVKVRLSNCKDKSFYLIA
jgi:hypothetical protein